VARTVRDAKLESRASREKLKVAGKPYYRAIDQGLHVGYRKGKTGGQWVMRAYDGAQKYTVLKIGVADDALDADGATVLSFAQAQNIARDRFLKGKRNEAGLPAEVGPYTVKQCMHDYLERLDREGKTGADARRRAEALIVPSLGATRCDRLTSKAITEWLDKVAAAPPRIRTAKGKPQKFREADGDEDPEEVQRRRRATANRLLTTLKAALNKAWRDKKVPSDDAWRAVRPFPGADAARIRYLTVAEAKRLINAAPADFRRLIQAALYTGARFSELAALEIADFNPDTGTVHIRRSKSGKARHVVLTTEGVDLFKSVCLGRTGRDRLLVKDDGARWGNNHQSRPMVDACAAAKIDPPIGIHGLRHTYASLTIMNGAPLLVVAKNLGHSDTRMVEKHYGHMSPSYVADAIRAAAPGFGFVADEKVVGL
jgi:integrase